MTELSKGGRSYYRLYIWEAPVRMFHWVNVLCVVVLAVTGYMIATPPALRAAPEAYQSFWFGWVRFAHFAAAYIFVVNIAVRAYWAFAGNRFARWSNYLPYRREHWREIGAYLRRYLLLTVRVPVVLAESRLQSTTYALMLLVVAFQVISGFGMYAAMSDSWFPQLFAWIVPLMGGDMAVRQWHHLMMWVILVFAIIHIYLVFFTDWIERRAVFSSIVNGWKFFERGEREGDPR